MKHCVHLRHLEILSNDSASYPRPICCVNCRRRTPKAVQTAGCGALRLPCKQCGTVFDTRQKLVVHSSKALGVTAPIRRKLDCSGRCYVCLLQFANRRRFLEHLAEKGRKSYFVSSLPDIDDHEWHNIEAVDRELDRF